MSLNINGKKLKNLIKGSGLTQEEAAKKLNVSRQTLSTWLKYELFDDEILQNVKTNLFPSLGENKEKELNLTNAGQTISSSIPMYNFPVAAGGVETYNNPDDVKIVGHLNIPGAHKEAIAIPAYGHSMYPTLANGDWAVSRPINDPTEIVWGEVYYIEWSDYKMYKRLLHSDNDGEVILWSDNQLDKIGDRPKFAPLTIKKEKIRKLRLVTEILKKPNY